MVGYAYQLGALPLSADAIEQAIELNGEAVAMNLAAFQLGPPRRARSAAVEALAKPAPETATRTRAAVAVVRRDGRAARRIPHRLSERRLCGALPRAGRAGEGGRSREGAGPERARRGGRALSVQADGLQGRVRGRAALHRRQFPRAGRRTSSTATSSRFEFHLAPPLLRARTTGDRRAAEDELRPVDAAARSGCSRSFKFLRGTPFDIFGYRTSAAPSAS